MSRPSDNYRVADAFDWKNPWHDQYIKQEFPHLGKCKHRHERIDMLVRMDIEWADYITDNGNIGVGRPRTALSPELEEYKRRLDAGESMMGLTDLSFD